MPTVNDTVEYRTHSDQPRTAFVLQLPEVPEEHTEADKQFLALAAKHGYVPATKPAKQFTLKDGQAVLGVVEETPRLRVYLRVSEQGTDGIYRKANLHGSHASTSAVDEDDSDE